MIHLVGRRPAEKLRQINESAELIAWRCGPARSKVEANQVIGAEMRFYCLVSEQPAENG
jgi:hypothetical protein